MINIIHKLRTAYPEVPEAMLTDLFTRWFRDTATLALTNSANAKRAIPHRDATPLGLALNRTRELALDWVRNNKRVKKLDIAKALRELSDDTILDMVANHIGLI